MSSTTNSPFENYNNTNLPNKFLSAKEFKERTNGGYDFYNYVFSKHGVQLNGKNHSGLFNPFCEDTIPSFSIHEHNGEYFFKDFGDESYSGDVLTFAGHYYKLDPKYELARIIDYASRDLGINLANLSNDGLYNDANKLNKKHIRLITDSKQRRFIFLHESQLNLRKPTNEDCDNIYQILCKDFSVETLNKAEVLINDSSSAYGLVFWGSEQKEYNPNNLKEYLHVEGRTDFLSLIQMKMDQNFALVSHFNIGVKISLKPGLNVFLMDADVDPEQIKGRLIYKDDVQVKFIRLGADYKDISDWLYEDKYLKPELFELIKNSAILNLEDNVKKVIGDLNNPDNPESPNNPDNLGSLNNHDIDRINSNSISTQIYKISDLMNEDLPPVKWIIEGLIPEGYCLIAGSPKSGKSWLSISLSLVASKGGRFLSQFQANKCGVLYISLEDSKKRLQDRINLILALDPSENRTVPENFFYLTDILKANKGGLEQIDKILTKHPEIKLVIIDTLKRFLSHTRSQFSLDEEYEQGALLQKLAMKHGVTIIGIVHTRKMKSTINAFDDIAGTVGMQAAPDTMMVLTRKPKCSLFVTGRDIEENEYQLEFNNGLWSCLGFVDDIETKYSSEDWDSIFKYTDEIDSNIIIEFFNQKYKIERATAFNWINKAVDKGQIIRLKKGLYKRITK
jgi:hypothetical protein